MADPIQVSKGDAARWQAMAEQAALDAERKKKEAEAKAKADAEAARLAMAAQQAAKTPELDPATKAKLDADRMAAMAAKAREQSAWAGSDAEALARLEAVAKPMQVLTGETGPVTQPTRGQAADTARLAGLAASSVAPSSGTPAGHAADVARLTGAAIESGKPKEAEATAETDMAKTASGAADLVTASPLKVGEVLDKLKAEEAKGGPGFWDVIQAAAAGWGGQVPLYVQKEIAAKEAETEQAKTEALLARQAEISKTERAEEQEFQRGLAREEMANRLKLAGLAGVGGLPRLGASEFVAGGQ